MATLERAIEIASQAHAGQVDKGGADYIGHPLRVMEMCETEEQKIVGVLHDVVEDSDWTFEMLEEEGFAPAIIEALKCVTKLSEGEDYDDFISRVMINPLAVKVKLYDIEDNLDVSRLDSLTDADVARCKKYLNARDRLKAELIRLESQQ
jgi:(p)ppGpp synthase/HD superfamily hydrolase